jgi:hypothetical protein
LFEAIGDAGGLVCFWEVSARESEQPFTTLVPSLRFVFRLGNNSQFATF